MRSANISHRKASKPAVTYAITLLPPNSPPAT